MKTTSIMIVGSGGIVRDGYQALFGAIPELTVLGPADDGLSATAKLAAEKPNLMVLDSSVNEDDVNDIISAIRQSRYPTRCLAICPTKTQLRKMREFGSVAAVLEGIPPAELVVEVRRLAGMKETK